MCVVGYRGPKRTSSSLSRKDSQQRSSTLSSICRNHKLDQIIYRQQTLQELDFCDFKYAKFLHENPPLTQQTSLQLQKSSLTRTWSKKLPPKYSPSSDELLQQLTCHNFIRHNTQAQKLKVKNIRQQTEKPLLTKLSKKIGKLQPSLIKSETVNSCSSRAEQQKLTSVEYQPLSNTSSTSIQSCSYYEMPYSYSVSLSDNAYTRASTNFRRNLTFSKKGKATGQGYHRDRRSAVFIPSNGHF